MDLKDYQELIKKLCEERGYFADSTEETFLLLAEEVGELAKAIRQQSSLQNGDHSKKKDLEDELADVFWLTLALANKLDVDLETAFQNKEKTNQDRYNNNVYNRSVEE